MNRLLFAWINRLMPHSHEPDKPCQPMKGLLSELSDDSLNGFKRWFTIMHVDGCPGCSSTLQNLKALRGRLSGLGKADVAPKETERLNLTPERRAAVEAAWAKFDEVAK